MTKKTLASITFAVTFALSFTAWADPTAPRKTLKAFASEEEFAELFKGWAAEYQRRRDEQRGQRHAQGLGSLAQAPASAPASAKAETAGAAVDEDRRLPEREAESPRGLFVENLRDGVDL